MIYALKQYDGWAIFQYEQGPITMGEGKILRRRISEKDLLKWMRHYEQEEKSNKTGECSNVQKWSPEMENERRSIRVQNLRNNRKSRTHGFCPHCGKRSRED